MTHGLFRYQWSQPLHVVVGLPEASLRGRQLRLGFGQRRLERFRVDHIEEIALLDEGTFGERNFIEIALDPGSDLDILRSACLPNQFHIDGHITLNDFRDEDFGWRSHRKSRLIFAAGDQNSRA